MEKSKFIFNSLLDLIGNNPVVEIPIHLTKKCYAKLEYLNPSGSIKDRSALYMIRKAVEEGTLKKDGAIIEASSGNQGIAAAMIGSVLGYKVIITVSEKISTEKKRALEAYGATLIECDKNLPFENPNSYHGTALRLSQEIKGSFMLNQYYNIDNLNAHYYGIARELYSELEGKISHLVMAVGTFGTAVGVGKHFKERGSKIKIIGVDSAASFRSNNGIQLQTNLEGIGVPHDAPLYSSDFIDEIYTVSDEEAILMLKKLAHQQGLLVGPASGATAYIASKLLEEREDVTSVGIICTDSGRAYLSKNFYSSDSISASSSSSVASSSSSAEIKLDSLVE